MFLVKQRLRLNTSNYALCTPSAVPHPTTLTTHFRGLSSPRRITHPETLDARQTATSFYKQRPLILSWTPDTELPELLKNEVDPPSFFYSAALASVPQDAHRSINEKKKGRG